MILYTAIILYILSLIIGLFLMTTVKSLSNGRFFFFSSVHVLFLVTFLLTKNTSSQESSNNLLFLFFICSGVVLAGLAWRTTILIPFKIYFSMFAVTILLFIFSPSRLMVFLLTGKYTETLGKTFPVGDNYFLEQQSSSSDTACYKLIRKHGMFHQTIQRNIVFKGKLDSIHVLEFFPEEKASIRGFSGKVTYVSTEIDSVDIELQLNRKKQNEIERKL